MQLFMCYTLLQPKIHHFSPKYYYYTLGRIHPEGLAACSFTRIAGGGGGFMYVFAFICGVAVCRTMVKEVKVECSPSRFGHNFTRQVLLQLLYIKNDTVVLLAHDLFFTMPPRSMRFLIMYPLLRLCVVFLLKRVKLMHIQLCVKSYTLTCV